MCGAGGTSIEVCTGTFSLTQSEYRQTDRQTDRSILCNSCGWSPSPCPASETPPASAPPRLRDTCDGSPSAERERKRREGKERSERGKGEEEERVIRGRRTRVDQASRPASVGNRTLQTHQGH